MREVVALPIGQARHQPLPFRRPIPVDGAACIFVTTAGLQRREPRRLGFFHSSALDSNGGFF